MIRVKKLSDAVFPRDFSKALESFSYNKRPSLLLQEEQIKKIRIHYQNELQNLQNKVPKVRKSKEVNKLEKLYNEDPFVFAEAYNINYKLTSSDIRIIKKQISDKLFKSKTEKKQIESLIQEKELAKLSDEYNKLHNQLLNDYPSKTVYVYESSEKSKDFKKKYENNYIQYAKDFNLDLFSLNSEYSFIYMVDTYSKKKNVFIENEERPYYFKTHHFDADYYIMDILTDDFSLVDSKVLMYYPRFDWTAFFLYKNCLYQAEYNEVFSDEELLLLVKEKLYKDDKKFSQLKKQIELYENSEVANTSKRAREPISEDVKFEVWRRDQGRCVICGSQENLEFDHIIPFSKGGSSTARNIQLLCQNCNRHKSDKI